MEVLRPISKLLAEAKQAEADDDYEQAITLYEQVIKADPVHEHAYNRLMIIYRKLKFYKDELRTINNGLKAYEKLYKPSIKGAKAKKIAEISNSLLKSTGLADKKGNHLYEPEPIAGWKKRKIIVEKKLEK
ncbi:hypothetical protein [Aridibaculum aurantiacum]|uniref:hypothetical protein n=1 Tax=Aridibaculum aurantiacum TaxID=2810307 RepID=UPI001A970CEC|nr:hypothetical protein [Aridibaculum aurantiacum]